MFSCYLKLERRQSIKKDGTETSTPRYVVTEKAGYFKPLESIKSTTGEIVMYHNRNGECNKKSTAETRLQCKGSLNFSSIYLNGLKVGEALIGYGEPPREKELKGGKQNPFYDNRDDGYLFIISPDMTTIEILIVDRSRQLIRGYAQQLSDGQMNEALNELRKAAKSE